MNNRQLIKVGAAGSFFTALCCFTPLLVWILSMVGVAGLVAYLDFALLPLLAVFIVLLVVGLVRQKKRG